MIKKIKVATVVGTRPEIIRLSRVMAALDHYTDHIIIHTGQNYDYELNEIFFNDLEIRKPDHFLNAAGKNAAETIGNTISKVDQVLETVKPDAILVLGDTNSCLSVIPAKRKKIPVFWGGALSYEFPIDKSDYGFTPSDRYEFSVLALSGPLKFLKTNTFQISSIGVSFIAIHSTQSEWKNEGKTPNSEATAFIPGLSILFGSKAGTFGINVQKGYEEYANNPV